ncbi:FtsX-like permease family protein [Streptomyces zagrosensis]|uniref:ABC3 transporter permease C-terminal domain-containing protein n=1 Tax=Streptomyces zagrosensis TaxID=1042984 RepID=A0A7W9Q941_9ACTN|nr:FtsX-like permease family protein [Streptomyces zagrosensis]MBB5935634.1 hypothetical protein [Streptomyces zagrosensis]
MRALDRTTWTLSWRLLRGGGRVGALGTGLAVAAAALCTALLLLCVAINAGFQDRAARTDWRGPVASAHPVAMQAVSTAFTNARPVTVVDLARLGAAKVPAPPGMPRFPEPGEVWTSPALGALIDHLPRGRGPALAPGGGERAGTLGRAALTRPGELVAVVGHGPRDPAMTAPREADPRRPGDIVPPTPIADFDGRAEKWSAGGQYTALAKVATVLVIVPLLVLGASAARLSVSRRDQRLAALRLIGATPSRIAGVTTAEAAVTGAVGALFGAAGYAALLPLAAAVPVAGGHWYTADLWVGTPTLLGVLAAVVLMVVGSALAGLRQVVIGPLGVARRAKPPRMKAVRAVVFVGALALYWQLTKDKETSIGSIVYFIAAVFLTLSVVGPWVVGLLGRIVARRARRPATLLAGRRLIDDPKSAWRAVSGLTLAGFVAGFFALMTVGADASWGPANRLALAVPEDRVTVVRAEAEQRLAHAGVRATVGTDDAWIATKGDRSRQVTADVSGGAAELDRARTALTGLVPGQHPVTGADVDWSGTVFAKDFRRAILAVLGATFVVAISSAGITAASAVLDRRRTYGLLHLAGTPLRVLDRARRIETVLPVAVLGGGAVLTGIFCAAPLTLAGGSASLDARGAALLACCLGLGFAGLVGASALSRPLLRSVTRAGGPRPG